MKAEFMHEGRDMREAARAAKSGWPKQLAFRAGLPRLVRQWLPGVLLAAALLGPAHAQDGGYRLAPGDRLTVTVYGQSDLSGEFLIGGEGSILLPLVGEVGIGNLTVQDARKRIADRLSDGFLQQPTVSLRITEMRPIYVLGDVRTAGSYPFRYGSTVLTAIALAGGYSVPEQLQSSQRIEFLLSDERVRVLEATRRLLMVRRTRLDAQRKDAEDFVPPLVPDSTADQLVRITADEREILTSQRKAMNQAVNLMREQKPRLQAEIAGVQAQRQAEETQLGLIQSHLDDYTKLMASGLARRYTGIELQREEARNKGMIARLNADLARLDLNIGDLTLRIDEVIENYRRRVMTELQDVSMRINEIETQLPSAREVRASRLQSGGELTFVNTSTPQRKVFITRNQDGRSATIEVDERATLAPGDIIDIRRERPNPIAQVSAVPSQQPPQGQQTLQGQQTVAVQSIVGRR